MLNISLSYFEDYVIPKPNIFLMKYVFVLFIIQGHAKDNQINEIKNHIF